MATNPNDTIISEFNDICRRLLESAVNSEPGRSAFEMEKLTFSTLLEIGAATMRAYFATQAAHYRQDVVTDPEGRIMHYRGERRGRYYSIYGDIDFWRSYCCGDGEGFHAMDAGLNLPKTGQSDYARMMVEELANDMSFEKATAFLAKYFRMHASTRAVQQAIMTDSQDAEAYYAQATAPPICQEATILAVEADNKGVPVVKADRVNPPAEEPSCGRPKGGRKRDGKTRDSTVISVSTHIPFMRTPEQVRDSLFRERESTDRPYDGSREKPVFKRTWATMNGKKAALAQAAIWTQLLDNLAIVYRIALTDGADALQRRVDEQFPGFIRILDLIHAIQYLWKAADAQFGKGTSNASNWVYNAVLRMLQGHTHQIIAELDAWLAQIDDSQAARWKPIETSATYFEKNLHAMKYNEYLENGWPIATGIIEGACRNVVKDRCEQSGMKWTLVGVEAFLHLRCILQNGDWEDYHAFRIKRRHETVYGITSPAGSVSDTVIFHSDSKAYARAA